MPNGANGARHSKPSSTPTATRLNLRPFPLQHGSCLSVSTLGTSGLTHKSDLPQAITTVGYGEITPRSFLGRLVTLPLLVCGLFLIALPSFVLGREFSHVWERMSANQEPAEAETELDSPTMSRRPRLKGKDLSNLKLAQNQTELSRQIETLSSTVEAQGVMIQRLLDIIDKGKDRDR